MRKFALLLTACWLAFQFVARADVEPVDYAFLLSAQVAASPASITIRWPQKQVPTIYIRRKLLSEANWGATISIPGNSTSYTDTAIEPGKEYEYEFQAVVQDSPQQIAYGYICSGAIIPPVERRGKVLLVVDDRFSSALAWELETLRIDLIGDGWTVLRRDVSTYASPPDIKSVIRNEYNADPANMRAVFLIGHVPVPFSGLINPDMHPNHLGAWPADVYYGEMDGGWTDYSVYKPDAEYSWNDNVPGDGKFDQSQIPGQVELEVGRVDFWDMPSFAPRSETDLLRNYLNKDHAFRHRTLNAALRGLIRDNFGTISGDAPAVDAWRAFPALFGQGNYFENAPNQFFPELQNNSYLFAYAGGGGDWEKADGVGSTADFVNGDPKAVFYLLHGSWFGDWDNEDNFLRAAIATPSAGLVSIWSSLPHWYLHPLAMGETIGFCTRLVQNNQNGVYRNSADLSNGQVHISMQGDPTLRAFPLAPPSNLQLSVSDKLTLSWNPAWQAVDGYQVYYASSYEGPFQRATRVWIPGTTLNLTLPPAGHYVYMVKSVALQTTGSGTFNNMSQGIFVEADLTGTPPPIPEISIATTDATGSEDGDQIIFTLSRTTPIDSPLNVNLNFSGSATLGQDYQAPTTITFAAGSATAALTITPTKDATTEDAETIVASIAGGSGYNIGSANSANATVAADPPPPPVLSQVSITATDATGDESGDPIVLTLTRTTPVEAALTVMLQFSGAATAGQDFNASTNVTFAAGSPNATLTIMPLADGTNEPDESIVVTLITNTVSQYFLGTNITATATIKANAESRISDANLSAVGSFGFTATGFPNRAYRIEARTPTGGWTSKTNGVANSAGSVTYREKTKATGACVWYRIVWL